MTIGLLWITDGRRDCLDAAARSLSRMWRGEQPHVTVVDDSGDPDHRDWVQHRCRRWWRARLIHHDERQGFAAAIATGWEAMRTLRPDWVFHAEEDFVYERPVDVPAMVRLLTLRPHLVQVSLLRNAVNEAELAAGGLVQSRPGAFEDHELLVGTTEVLRWMEQRAYFTTNPSLYPGRLSELGWPQVPDSEGIFTHQLLRDGFGTFPGSLVAFGVMGSSTDEPAVTHIGVRQGTGY